MVKQLPRRKGIRLAPEAYNGPAAFSVTISTADRAKLVWDGRSVELCLAVLGEISSRYGMEVLAYCFMPDHLHLLLEAPEAANLIRFMKAFKQVSGYQHRRKTKRPLWQKGYYDHVLRKDEDVVAVAQYIFENPLRASMVSSVDQYPFLGGSLLAGDLKVAPTSVGRGR